MKIPGRQWPRSLSLGMIAPLRTLRTCLAL
jgi:hypothetical protein